MLLLFHLLLLFPFGALLIVNCGKEKKKPEAPKELNCGKEMKKPEESKDLNCGKEPKKPEESKESLADSQEKAEKEKKERIARDEKHKKNFGNQNEETDRVWEDCKEITGTCNCFEQFKPPCDLAYRLRMGYNTIREHCHGLANIHGYTNIKYWTLYEEDIGTKLYMPHFREIKKTFQERHGDCPLNQKEANEILGVIKQIEKDFELVVEAKKKHEQDETEIGQYLRLREETVFHGTERWMKPSWFEEYDKETKRHNLIESYHRELKVKPAWKGRKEFDDVIKTCHKKKKNGGGECDFIRRADFFIGQWRIHAQNDPPFPKKGWLHDEGDEYRPTAGDSLKYDAEICDAYMKKVDEAKEEHRGHLKEPKELDEWFQLHKEKTRELKEKYEEYEKGPYRFCWDSDVFKLIGYKEKFVEIPLGEEEKE